MNWRAEISVKALGEVVGLLAAGSLGGFVALWIGLPMPFLLGALTTTAIYAIVTFERSAREAFFPPALRASFVAIIGAMIGAGFSPDVLEILPDLWISILALVGFTVLAQVMGYGIMRRVGRYDPPTALFAAMPGGLYEAIEFAEKAGSDPKVMTVQHFARIVVVVVSVPFLFYLWTGEIVGSAAGEEINGSSVELWDVLGLVAIGLIGRPLGIWLRIPASSITGSILLSAILHGTGVIDFAVPAWLMAVAQLVVGVGLGAQFSGARLPVLAKAFGLSIVMVGSMLLLAISVAWGVHFQTPLGTDALFISLAPGGITEMGLIALSLSVSPVVVAAHHLIRIFIVVSFVQLLGRLLGILR